MRCMQLDGGDIVLTNNRVSMARGRRKLEQDIARWIGEPYGSGPTTPSFGNNLGDLAYNLNTPEVAIEVRAEIARILGLYKSDQMLKLTASAQANMLGCWSKDEVIDEIVNITSREYLDKLYVKVLIRTKSDELVSLNLTVTESGTTVA